MPRCVRFSLLLLPLVLLLVVPATVPAEAGDLADEHRTGTVLSVQGSALVRPGGRRRWTPVGKDAVLLPGDLVKTQTRGAHALEIQLPGDGSLLMGPGAQVLLPEPGRLEVLAGEMEVKGRKDAAVQVKGPGGFALEVSGTAWLRVKGTQVVTLEKPPRWLEGYRASTGEEWMGSLLANVDGRNVPLAVGYHKVTVDVRDQIARTTVEQSFVNTTDGRLEGVFYFPLPADASISGFGMWIGGELVEADVVEKARARQIYEDILRRKKDPGLLEWQGGNLFKARVFPIEPHSQKRVRVRYTQVVRLEGDTWRYRYALRSDLLRSKPLRRLDVQINVLSTRAMTRVECPSHATRITSTGHEARVELSAEEYVPTRDLEVAVTLKPTAGLDAITHRRGDEGWFMLLVTPPEPEAGGWTRTLLPEGDPLEVVVVADTSGSMDQAARETQTAFVSALLALLGEKDRFRLAAADVDLTWAFDGARPVTDASVADALTFLETRTSLGWTDLDRAIKGALDAAGRGALILYVGDGIPTAGDADVTLAADRLRLRVNGSLHSVHAVSPSSTYEQPVLDALASGGGSVRRADGDPAGAAYALLAEAARPVLKDVRVTIEGVPTARVYPETLPNLPLGSQQVVLGRFLPKAEAQSGTVVVTGDLGGQPVRYETSLDVPALGADDIGNSFLPRLWARKHLDVLLQQGRSAAVKEEIVGFSAEYGILTPYTSLLVLESDEDRERYGVTRTVKMRDGEAFFAEGRDKVQLEMQREQARAARAWRLGLRRKMLREIAGLGRDLVPDRPMAQAVATGELLRDVGVDFRGLGAVPTAGVPVTRLRSSARELEAAGRSWGADGGLHRGAPGELFEEPVIADHVETDNDLPFEESLGSDLEAGGDAPFDFVPPAIREPSDPTPPPPSPPSLRPPSRGRRAFDQAPEPVMAEEFLGRGGRRRLKEAAAKRPNGGVGYGGYLAMDELLESKREASTAHYARPPTRPAVLSVESVGFPYALPVAESRPKLPAPAWAPEVLTVLRTLDRREALAALPGGVEVRTVTSVLHPVRGEAQAVSRERALAGGVGWYVRRQPYRSEAAESWADGTVRVRVHAFRGLGRRRAFLARDAKDVPSLVAGLAFDGFQELFRWHHILVKRMDEDQVRLVIQGRTLGSADRHLLVDTTRGVILEERTVQDGFTIHRIRRADHVQVGGLWWPGRTEVIDAYGRTTATATTEVRALDATVFASAFAKATTPAKDVVFLDGALPKPGDVVQAIHEQRGTFTDYLLTALDLGNKRQWDEAFAAFDTARSLVEDTTGTDWIRLALLAQARRGPELLRAAESLGHRFLEPDVAQWAASRAYQTVQADLGASERLALLDHLREPWLHPTDSLLMLSWLRIRDAALRQARRTRDAEAIRAEIVERWPYDVQALAQHVDDLVAVGDTARAVERLRARLVSSDEEKVFTWEETNDLYRRLSDLLWQQRDIDALASLTREWAEAVPLSGQAWLCRASAAFLQGHTVAVDAATEGILRADVPTDPRSAEYARLGGALTLALGRGAYFSQRRIHAPFLPALVGLGIRLGRTPIPPRSLLHRLLHENPFRRTEEARLLREGLRADVLAEGAIQSMSVRRLQLYGTSLSWRRSEVEDEVFAAALASYRRRFEALEAGRERKALGDTILAMLDAHGDKLEATAFLRSWVAGTDGYQKSELASLLFDRLLRLDYTLDRETEAFALLPTLLHPYLPGSWPNTAATASRKLAKWATLGRRKVAYGPPEETAALTRAEAKVRAKEASRKARTGLAARLAEMRTVSGDVYRPWLELERLGYAVELGDDLPATAAAARELLDQVSKTAKTPLDSVVAERAVLVLAYAATRRGSPDGLANDVLALLTEREADAQDKRLDWRYQIFRLLVALDRAEGLETTLGTWIRPHEVRSAWRVVLGYLLAETGRIQEAAALFEAVAAQDELSVANWNTLAGWYLVLGDDVRREVALEGRMKAMTENDLSSRMWQVRSKVQRRRGGVPGDIEVEDLRAIRWLLTKASRPQNYTWQLRHIYNATKDHRVLQSIAQGLVGHTPEGIYGFLRDSASLVNNVHEEATIDEAAKTIETLRSTATASHDRRGLALLESILAGRAALVPKADPAWLERASRAIEVVGQGAFARGERHQVAEVIAAGAPVKHPALAKARVALVQSLWEAEPQDSPYRLSLAHALARILWAHGERDAALDRWAAALAEIREHTDTWLPDEARSVFRYWIDRLAEVKRYAVAETSLGKAIAAEARASVRAEHRQRLHRLYAQALEGRGRLSIGEGEGLFTEAAARIDAWLAAGPPAQANNTTGALVHLHRSAQKGRAVRDAGARLETWARERMPRVFDRYVLASTSLVRTAAGGIKELRDPKHALLYLLDRMGTEPAFFGRIGLDLWASANWELARWRKDAGRIAAADEKRLLPYVIRSLEDYLNGLGRTGRGFWDPDYDRYWREKSDAFAATAHRAVELHPENETVQRSSAAYLREIGRLREAVAVLQAAYARDNLDAHGDKLLARWLVADRRFEEALPLLETLTGRYAELELRLLLSQTLHGLGRGADALKVLAQAEAWLKERESWTHATVVQLGARALEQEMAEAANGWLEEAIRLRLLERGGRRTNDSTLGRIYGLLARARVALGRTDEAVDAASASVVAWGHNRKRRGDALEVLKRVLAGAKDLDAWVETYEGRVADSGLDAPLLRKTLASVYVDQGKHAQAVHHLRAARELAPEDAEIHRRLVQAYDALGRADEAIDALLASLRMAPRNLDAAADLAERFEKAKRETQALRARANLVEPLPHESAGHRRLAALLEKRQETEGAAVQWQQVVRTDPLDPTGWLALARVQIALGRGGEARRALEHVLKEDWESRFGDVKKEASTWMSRLADDE